MLKNSAPHAQTASFPIGKAKPQWGETTWLWPDFRMDTNTHIVLGQTGDYEGNQAFSSGGWFMLRSAPNYNLDNETGSLLSKMDSAQHNRGWDLVAEKGVISVELVNQGPKDLGFHTDEKSKKAAPKPKEVFQFPTPADLTAKDLAPNKPKKEAPKTKEEKKKETKPAVPKPVEDKTPFVAIKVSTEDAFRPDGHWRHIFFTYDGSGKASGIRIYVNGSQVKSKVVVDTLGQATIRTQAPMQLGWRYPDANPSRETRYQDVRLYGRALSGDEVRRLPFEDYVAEVTAKPADKWNTDEEHVVSQFYFDNVDESAKAINAPDRSTGRAAGQAFRGRRPDAWFRGRSHLRAYAHVLTRGVYIGAHRES